MAYQTTYGNNISAARAGQIANEEMNNLISRTVQNSGGIAFGAGVARDSANDNAAHTFTTGDTSALFLGVAVRERDLAAGNATDTFAQYDSVRIMTKGVIWVVAGETVAPGQPVYLTTAGAWLKTVGSNILVANGVWESSATVGGLAKLRLN